MNGQDKKGYELRSRMGYVVYGGVFRASIIFACMYN